MTFAVWVTGLPGSGKSTIISEFLKLRKAQVLCMDDFRKFLTPKAKYIEEEREVAYRTMILVGRFLYDNGINVVLDATAHRRRWRDLARAEIKNFKEVYVKCPLQICIERESKRPQGAVMADMYRKALERKKTGKQYAGLGEVVGVDVKYEEGAPDLVIESDKIKPEDAARKIYELVKNL